MITITDRAKQYLTQIADGKYVALSLKSGGCSGFTYVWERAEQINNQYDGPYEGILLVDKISEIYILGSTIDYITSLEGSFLTVINPLAKSQCGCGESFAV